MSKTKFVNTNIKFTSNGKDNTLVSFITKDNASGAWKGCRQAEECPKMVVVPAKNIIGDIRENVLYKARLVPMIGKKGYVAVQITLVQHEAKIETIELTDGFVVTISWGNRKLTFDPQSKNAKFNTIPAILDTLATKTDIRNIGQIMDSFEKIANIEIAYHANI